MLKLLFLIYIIEQLYEQSLDLYEYIIICYKAIAHLLKYEAKNYFYRLNFIDVWITMIN